MDKSQQSNPSRLKTLLILLATSTLIACTVSILMNISIFKTFISLPYISGWDGASHIGVMQKYSEYSFPSTWGWISEWFTGMPFPVFYPPLVYYFGSIIFRVLEFCFGAVTFVTAYKTMAHLILVLNALVTSFVLIKIFNIRRITQAILLGVVAGVFLGANTGAPSTFSIYLTSSISQNLSMPWMLLALYFILRKSTFGFFIGSICCMLIQLSNAHTALTFGLVSFLFIFADVFSIPTKRQFGLPIPVINFRQLVRDAMYIGGMQTLGFIFALFWIIPMLTNYDYFTGVSIASSNSLFVFIKHAWPYILIAISGYIVVIKSKNDFEKKIYSIVALSFLFTILVQVYQAIAQKNFFLPVHISRWYETLFFLLVIPSTSLVLHLFKQKKLILIGTFLVLAISTHVFTVQIYQPGLYNTYVQDHIPQLLERLKNKNGLISVATQSSPTDSVFREMTMSSQLGIQGNKIAISNIRESSINSLFLRIARNAITLTPENWALTTFFSPPVQQILHIDSTYPLNRFLGIESLVLQKKDLMDREIENLIVLATSSKKYSLTDTPKYIIADTKDPAPFMSIIDAPLTLLITEPGFRERQITDPVYTRFQEMYLESELYQKTIAFRAESMYIDDNQFEINQAKYIVLAMTRYHDLERTIQIIKEATRSGTYFFILPNDDSDEFKALLPRIVREKNVFVLNNRIPAYPFEQVNQFILKEQKENLKEIAIESMRDTPFFIHGYSSTTPSLEGSYLPIFIRQSYFPAWQGVSIDKNGSPRISNTYLASPGYTLAFIEKNEGAEGFDFSLIFTAPKHVLIAHLISAIALIVTLSIAIAIFIFERRKM